MVDNGNHGKVNLSNKYSEIEETCAKFIVGNKINTIELAENEIGRPYNLPVYPSETQIQYPKLEDGLNLAQN